MANVSCTNGEIQKKNIGHYTNFLEISSLVGDTVAYNDVFKYSLASA